jgi:hypothetical protein
MGQYKVGEAFAIRSEYTRTHLVGAGVKYQPPIHRGNLFNLGLEDALGCFTAGHCQPVFVDGD